MPVEVLDGLFARLGLRKKLLVRETPLTGGINNAISARWITEDHCAEGFNIDLNDPSRPNKFDGYVGVTIGTSGIAGALTTKRPSGLAYLNPSSGDKFLVLTIPNAGSGKTYYTLQPQVVNWAEALVSGSSFDPQNDSTPMFQGNDLLWIIAASGVPLHVLDNTAALTASSTATTDAPPNMVDGCYFQNRVWLLSATGLLYWSNVLPTTPIGTFDQSAQVLTLSPNRGSRAVALRPWRDQSLIALFRDSIEEVIVDNDPTSDILNSQRNIVDPLIGCASRRSAVAIGDDLIFMDQYGQVRSLKRSAEANIQGAESIPLSEKIRDELPGNLNLNQLDKVSAHVFRDRLFISYPRGISTEANYQAVYDWSLQNWVGIRALAHPVGNAIQSNIEGVGEKVYFCNGSVTSPTADVFEDLPGNYSHDGTAITFQLTTRAYDFDTPGSKKVWEWAEIEYHGDVGATPTVKARADEVGDFTTLTATSESSTSVAKASGSDFPLVPTDFPLVPGDFPLVAVDPPIVTARYKLDDNIIAPGRSIQLQITEATDALNFKLVGWRIVARVLAMERQHG